MKSHIWSHVVTKKVLNKSKYILDFRFFKVATCLDDSFAHSWHSLKQLHLELFPSVLKEFPYMLSTCWLLFHHSVVQLIPNHLNWVEVRWLWRPGHLMHALHHSPSWSNSLYTVWRCVLDHCPIKKQMIVPLSTNQMGGHIAAECCGSHAGYVCLEF